VIRVEFVKGDLNKILRAFKRIERAVKREKFNLPMRQALDYRELLTSNILTEKYASVYPPYNERYKAWKETYFASMGFLKMRRTMVDNLTVYRGKYKNWVYSGLPPGLMVSGSSWFGPPGKGKPVSVNMYAWVNEYGGNWGFGVHPARPVWRPTKDEYQKDGFINRGNESLELIKRSWQ